MKVIVKLAILGFWQIASEVAEKFFAAVCEWNSEIRDELLVFEDGYWDKNPELFQSIQSSTFENLFCIKLLNKIFKMTS